MIDLEGFGEASFQKGYNDLDLKIIHKAEEEKAKGKTFLAVIDDLWDRKFYCVGYEEDATREDVERKPGSMEVLKGLIDLRKPLEPQLPLKKNIDFSMLKASSPAAPEVEHKELGV